MATRDPRYPFEIEFYEDPESGVEFVRKWILEELTAYQRRALGVALAELLQRYGVDVCAGEYGKPLGDGLFEFRLRHDADEIIGKHTDKIPRGEKDQGKIALRVFCHAYGDKIVLLLSGYDKAAHPGARRQDREIDLARKRLREFRSRVRGQR
jgi:phage-related protein